ncbi:MAG TPA: Ig-like domain-containing protein, partial [Gemmatimonadaceae bacterium]|nr:Ig-like domain-containing protein [Gemmatimonadaceae bacterium]
MTRHLLRLLAVVALAPAPLHAQEDSLHVLRHTPGDTSSPSNIVTVTFDRPVAGRLDATTDAARIFHIAPATAGKVAWRDPITIRFVPDEPLPPGARFVVTIDTGFSAIDGSKLAAPYRFSFRVPGPRLLVRSYRDYYARSNDQLRYDGKAQLLYSAPVNLAELARRIRVELTDCAGNASLTIAMRPTRQRPLTKDDPWPLQGGGDWD